VDDREKVVVSLIRRFEQAVRDHRDRVKTRQGLDEAILQRYFDVAFLLNAVKPGTEEGAIQVAEFLRSEFDEVASKAAEMLDGTAYYPSVVDRLFEDVATRGMRQWPNRQAGALASFSEVPEVRQRLLGCLRGKDEALRHGAVIAFTYLKERAGPEAAAELFAIAGNDDDELQSKALHGLHEIAPQDRNLRQLALRLVRSEKFWVRGHAIACLEPFPDRECIGALLASLLDEGGHDFDNAADAAKLLEKLPLDADQCLAPLMAAFETLLGREDKSHEENAAFRKGIEALALAFKQAAERRGESTEGLGTVSYSAPENLASLLRLLGKLGAKARPALPLIKSFLARPYVAGGADEPKLQEILHAIEGGDVIHN